MKSLIALSVLATFSSLVSAAQPTVQVSSPAAVTLNECYQRALKVSEALQITDQEILQVEAQYRQGVGAALPNLSWKMTQFWQDTSGVEQSSGGVQGTLLRSRRPESYFQLDQPLFHGLREYNGIKALTQVNEASRLQRRQAELNLLVDVADVFYTSLDLQQEIEALSSQRDLTEDRLTELERRVRLGRSRDSEVLSAQVEMASLDAQIEDTRQRWAVARQTLRFLTEVPPNVPLQDPNPAPRVPTLEGVLTKAGTRPDVLAAEKTRAAERFRIKYAQAGYWPDLDFIGRYYTERVGFVEDVKWDAELLLNVPIFSGFVTRSQVQEARARLVAAELDQSRLNRQVRQQVESAFENLRYTSSQAQHYAKAVDLANRNYKLQQQEYRLGLINNLQVLQVLSDLQDLKIRKLRADAALRLNDIRLRVSSGQGI
jgi:outer membrane protein